MWSYASLKVSLGLQRCARANQSGRSAAWLARLVRDQEVDGSNPFAPTIISGKISIFPVEQSKRTAADSWALEELLAVGSPDVFHLNGMLEEPAAFALFGI